MAKTEFRPFQAGPAFILPKLALGKADLAVGSNFALVEMGDVMMPLCFGDRTDFWGITLDLLAGKRSLLLPEWAATPLAKQYKTTPVAQYLQKTADLIDPPGSYFKATRKDIRRLEAASVIERLNEKNQQDFADLNKRWYSENKDLKFRTYDKTSIDWLIENTPKIGPRPTGLIVLGVRQGDQIVSFQAAAFLATDCWATYTVRFSREGPRGASSLATAAVARSMGAVGLEYANDGTADTTTIRERKEALSYAKQKLFRVDP